MDDLDDIHKVDDYVQAAACVLLFISRGYFSSKACIHEIEACMLSLKPLILVYEPQVNA